MPRRQLEFKTIAAAKAELERLRDAGAVPCGNWNLAQTCDHLAYFIEGSLDGHQFKTPWLLKTLFGPMAKRRILAERRMKSGVPTPQKPLPEPTQDEAAAVRRLEKALDRLQAHQGELHDSPFFGHLTPEEWKTLHLVHCAHHLSHLEPKSGPR